MKRTIRFLSILLMCIFVMNFSIPTFASNGYKAIELTPSKDSEKIYKKASIIVDEKGAKIKIDNKFIDKDEKMDFYTITIDLEKKIYRAEKIKGEKLNKIIDSFKMRELEYSNLGILSTTHYGLGVWMSTMDPAEQFGYADDRLNKTYHDVWWYGDGSQATFDSRALDSFAANPSSLGTHWYTDEKKWLSQDTIDGGRTVTSKSYTSFYNYDFADDNTITTTGHTIYIEMYKDGNATYTSTFSKSGEFSGLLSYDEGYYRYN